MNTKVSTKGNTKTRVSRRGAGREARHAQRTMQGAIAHPCPAGQSGGRYAPLLEHEMHEIIDTAYRLLAELGMGDVPSDLQERALAGGATLNAEGRLCYSRTLIEAVINLAPKIFMLYGCNPAHDLEVGGERVYYGTGGAAVQVLDSVSQEYRTATLKDLYDFTRLADGLENISWFTRICVATDIPDILEMDLNTVYALIAGTEKHVGTSFTLGSSITPAINMFDTAMGGAGKFAQRPCCKVHISPIISPLKYGEDAYNVAKEAVKHNMVINAIVAAQSGATAPAALAGMLVQTTAETLAALMMVHFLKPSYPMIFSNWPFVADLRTGSFAGSGGEITVLNAASAQIVRHLGLVGGMASLLGVSFEAMILDNEMLAMNQRVMRGVEVNEETLGYDAICRAVRGEGHFLGSDDTMKAMLRDYYYSPLYNRDSPAVWQEYGKRDAWQVAQIRLQEYQAADYPKYLADQADAEIRAHFSILLDPTQM